MDTISIVVALPLPRGFQKPPVAGPPCIRISNKAIGIMNTFINDIFEKLAAQSSRLDRYNKKPAITSCKIQTSVGLMLLGKLTMHAVSEIISM